MLRWLTAFLFLFYLGTSLHAQSDKPHILLMTGKIIEGELLSTDTSYVYYNFTKRNGKVEPKSLDLERVFSVTDAQGNEQVLYAMDTTVGNFFTEQEMRYYIQGEQDAMESYSANWTIFVGLPVTAGLGFVASSTVLVFAVPFVYLVGASLPKYKMRSLEGVDVNLLREPAYVLGYERTARSKRLFKSLVSAVAGTAIGFVVGQAVLE